MKGHQFTRQIKYTTHVEATFRGEESATLCVRRAWEGVLSGFVIFHSGIENASNAFPCDVCVVQCGDVVMVCVRVGVLTLEYRQHKHMTDVRVLTKFTSSW